MEYCHTALGTSIIHVQDYIFLAKIDFWLFLIFQIRLLVTIEILGKPTQKIQSMIFGYPCGWSKIILIGALTGTTEEIKPWIWYPWLKAAESAWRGCICSETEGMAKIPQKIILGLALGFLDFWYTKDKKPHHDTKFDTNIKSRLIVIWLRLTFDLKCPN